MRPNPASAALALRPRSSRSPSAGCGGSGADKAGGAAEVQADRVDAWPTATATAASSSRSPPRCGSASGGTLRIEFKSAWRAGHGRLSRPALIRDVKAGKADLGWAGSRAFDRRRRAGVRRAARAAADRQLCRSSARCSRARSCARCSAGSSRSASSASASSRARCASRSASLAPRAPRGLRRRDDRAAALPGRRADAARARRARRGDPVRGRDRGLRRRRAAGRLDRRQRLRHGSPST